MTDAWLDTLRSGRILIVDGAMGTELRRRGMILDAYAWSGPAALTHPDLLSTIHADYLRAGADVVTTNTFGTNRFVLDAAGLADRFLEINRAAVRAARNAFERAGRKAAIAGSISCLPPGFDISAYPDPHTESAAYEELAALLAELGVDLLALEMMEDVEHAVRACEAARRVGLPIWLGVSARLAADGRLVAYDFPRTSLSSILDALLGSEPAVVNVMHTPVAAVPAALQLLERRWRGYRGAYPEIGEEAGGAEAHSGDASSPRELASSASGWIRAGARVIGGCCGTTPAHIKALRDAVDALPGL
jgi:methionine synthase I (cobalamin-dependent)